MAGMSLGQWKDYLTRCRQDGSFGFSVDDLQAIVDDWEADRQDLDAQYFKLSLKMEKYEPTFNDSPHQQPTPRKE